MEIISHFGIELDWRTQISHLIAKLFGGPLKSHTPLLPPILSTSRMQKFRHNDFRKSLSKNWTKCPHTLEKSKMPQMKDVERTVAKWLWSDITWISSSWKHLIENLLLYLISCRPAEKAGAGSKLVLNPLTSHKNDNKENPQSRAQKLWWLG